MRTPTLVVEDPFRVFGTATRGCDDEVQLVTGESLDDPSMTCMSVRVIDTTAPQSTIPTFTAAGSIPNQGCEQLWFVLPGGRCVGLTSGT